MLTLIRIFFIKAIISWRKAIWKIAKFSSKNVSDYLTEKSKKKYPKVKSVEETINELLISKKSIARFGDGEFSLCTHESIGFQTKNIKLTAKMHEILKNNNKNCLIGILDARDVVHFNNYWLQYWYQKFDVISHMLDRKKIYYAATITRQLNEETVPMLKQIWENRNVIFVFGEGSRFDSKHKLFDNIKTQTEVLGKAINAWDEYDILIKKINSVALQIENPLVLCSLGPTATALAYDLSMANIQTIDLGHVTNSFDTKFENKPKAEDLPIFESNMK